MAAMINKNRTKVLILHGSSDPNAVMWQDESPGISRLIFIKFLNVGFLVDVLRKLEGYQLRIDIVWV